MQISDDNMKFKILVKCTVTCIFILVGGVVAAQCELNEYPVEAEPKSDILVANFGDWLVFSTEDKTRCWALSESIFSNYRHLRGRDKLCRGSSALFVTFDNQSSIDGQPSIKFGFRLNKSIPPLLIAKTKSFTFNFVSGEFSWPTNIAGDEELLNILSESTSVRIYSQSDNGISVADRFSLNGYNSAVRTAELTCLRYPMS